MNSSELHVSLHSLAYPAHDSRAALHDAETRLPAANHDEPDLSWDAWIDLGGEG
jgi:hypothetical protein